MLASAALHDRFSEAAPEPFAVVLDIAGRRVGVEPADAVRLRDAAAARAGRSSVARDLSLLLDRALRGDRLLALRHGEVQVLAQVAGELGLLSLAREIAARAA